MFGGSITYDTCPQCGSKTLVITKEQFYRGYWIYEKCPECSYSNYKEFLR